MKSLISQFKSHVTIACDNPNFVHREWFAQFHLEIVEKLALELCDLYPAANRDLVLVMVWLHDYGKILDFVNQYSVTLTAGRAKLLEIGFAPEFVDQAIKYIEILDKKLEVDLHEAPLEVQIVSSADGCSHMVGPFYDMWWYENANKPWRELMADNTKKALKDWNRKIVLPEARAAFEAHHQFILERSGEIPLKFLK